MTAFISWSGTLSQQVATLLSSWIEDVLQGAETWVSSEDIEKGAIWFGDVSDKLVETSMGILCLTRENVTAPWSLFEAGALSRGLSRSRVCPLLVDLSHADLNPPLSEFNGTLPTKEDMLKLVRTINNKTLTEEKLEKAFNRWWSDFDQKFGKIIETCKPTDRPQKSPNEMIAEILQIARSLQRHAQEPRSKYGSGDSHQTQVSVMIDDKLDAIENLMSMGQWEAATSVLNEVEQFLAQLRNRFGYFQEERHREQAHRMQALMTRHQHAVSDD